MDRVATPFFRFIDKAIFLFSKFFVVFSFDRLPRTSPLPLRPRLSLPLPVLVLHTTYILINVCTGRGVQ